MHSTDFKVENEAFASVINTGADKGKIKALAVGATTLTVKAGGKTATANLVVVPPRLVSVTLDPNVLDLTVQPGVPTQLKGVATFTDGHVEDITNDPNTSWLVNPDTPGIADITATGLVTGLAAGAGASTQMAVDHVRDGIDKFTIFNVHVSALQLDFPAHDVMVSHRRGLLSAHAKYVPVEGAGDLFQWKVRVTKGGVAQEGITAYYRDTEPASQSHTTWSQHLEPTDASGITLWPAEGRTLADWQLNSQDGVTSGLSIAFPVKGTYQLTLTLVDVTTGLEMGMGTHEFVVQDGDVQMPDFPASIEANVLTVVTMESRADVADNTPVRWRFNITKDGAEVVGVKVFFPSVAGSDPSTWTDSFTTDLGGVNYFPTAAATYLNAGEEGLTGDLPAEHPFAILFPSSGNYAVKVALLRDGAQLGSTQVSVTVP